MRRQLFDLRLLPAEGEAEVHDELAALARFAFKGDGAAHQVYDILGDGKAETRALNAADGGAFLVHKVRQMHRLFLDLHLAALDGLISSTSLMRESRCWLEIEIFFR